MKRVLIIALLSFTLLLAGCNGDSDDNDADETENTVTETEEATVDNGAAEAVLAYLQAKVDGDQEGVASLICSEMEANIANEALSFASVDASLSDDASCAVGETVDGFTLVTCEGAIEAIYGEDTRDFDLSTYRTVQEDGEWRWCGEG